MFSLWEYLDGKYELKRESDLNELITNEEPPKPSQTEEPKSKTRHWKFVAATYVLSICLILTGHLDRNACPADEKIPFTLMILGGLLLLHRLLCSPYDFLKVAKPEKKYKKPFLLVFLLTVCEIAAGVVVFFLCVYTFSISPTTKQIDKDLPNYCKKALHKFAFITSLLGLVIFGLGLPVISICCFYLICKGIKKTDMKLNIEEV